MFTTGVPHQTLNHLSSRGTPPLTGRVCQCRRKQLLTPTRTGAARAAPSTNVSDQPAAAEAPEPALSSSSSAQAAAVAVPTSPPAAQQQQQQQQRRRQQSAAAQSSRPQPDVGAREQQRAKPKPHLVRVAGRTSQVAAAAGAVVKRLRGEDMVRVAAIDIESLPKALIVLTAANNMAQANSGHMLVFQPTAISSAAAAEPPRVPVGSMVMYTTQIMAGEVMTFNTLRVTSSTDPKALSKAIIARLATHSHTVMECCGSQALAGAVQAVAQARKGLLVRGQDCACIITSTRKAVSTDAAAAEEGAAAAAADASGSSSSSKYPATCHRLVLVECEPRNPRALLMRSTVGVSDRVAQDTAAALDAQ